MELFDRIIHVNFVAIALSESVNRKRLHLSFGAVFRVSWSSTL